MSARGPEPEPRDQGADLTRLLRETERKLAEQIRVNADLEEALRAMELRALQAQINPHFLFNTLSAIAASSFMEGAPKTNDLVQALARLLRYTLRQIGQMVDLEEELRHVEDYLLIEKTRFGDRIQVVFDVDAAALPAKLPLLTIQPLIENAIIHGLESRTEGILRISVCRRDRWIKVEIADNGAGMDEEVARQFAGSGDYRAGSGDYRAGSGDFRAGSGPDRDRARGRDRATHVTGLGLDNVRRRLEHAFGENGGLRLLSRPGQGTTVLVEFPAGQPAAPPAGGGAPAARARAEVDRT